MTSELIARAGASLADGGWRYTRRQLYYATCAAAETPPRSPARSQLALGVLLGLIALILLPVRPAALAVGGLAALAFALGIVSLLTRRPPAGRALAVSFPEFESILATDALPPGLAEAVDAGAGQDAADGPVLVCDTEENAVAVAANRAHAHIPHLSVTTRTDGHDTGVTVIALHDASPRGCALPLELVASGCHVVDAGLRPAWIDGGRVQVLEGAVARMPRDLSMSLREDELDWLRSGRRVELAVLPPERLLSLVREAVERATSPVAVDEAGPSVPEPAPLGGQLFGLA
ncbi:MAG: hypothetical protein JOZ75_01460 [Candidatus Dormibacteraeota bacterium]|nr:hypothetical protein [Candidatus Dormibacteraeota bacterium]